MHLIYVEDLDNLNVYSDRSQNLLLPRNEGYFAIGSTCHKGAGVEAFYRKGTGVLYLACQVCRKPIARIKVSAKTEEKDLPHVVVPTLNKL